jgi:hypothetical protein
MLYGQRRRPTPGLSQSGSDFLEALKESKDGSARRLTKTARELISTERVDELFEAIAQVDPEVCNTHSVGQISVLLIEYYEKHKPELFTTGPHSPGDLFYRAFGSQYDHAFFWVMVTGDFKAGNWLHARPTKQEFEENLRAHAKVVMAALIMRSWRDNGSKTLLDPLNLDPAEVPVQANDIESLSDEILTDVASRMIDDLQFVHESGTRLRKDPDDNGAWYKRNRNTPSCRAAVRIS